MVVVQFSTLGMRVRVCSPPQLKPAGYDVLSQSIHIPAKRAEDWAFNELNVQAVLAAMGVGNAISTLLAGWFAAAWPIS